MNFELRNPSVPVTDQFFLTIQLIKETTNSIVASVFSLVPSTSDDDDAAKEDSCIVENVEESKKVQKCNNSTEGTSGRDSNHSI